MALDPVSIAAELAVKLGVYIVDAVKDGAKSEEEARAKAIRRLAEEHPLEPVLPKVEAQIAEARAKGHEPT